MSTQMCNVQKRSLTMRTLVTSITLVQLRMFHESAFSCKRCFAQLTFETLFVTVRSNVRVQTATVHEGIATNVAFEVLFASVYYHVPLQNSVLRKRGTTFLAHIVPFTGVNPRVHFPATVRRKCCSAFLAYVIPFTRVR